VCLKHIVAVFIAEGKHGQDASAGDAHSLPCAHIHTSSGSTKYTPFITLKLFSKFILKIQE
jgi:hypothetical protein